jgi:hypothetical protein
VFLNPVDFVVLITSDLACQNIVQAGSGEGLEVVQNHFDGHMNRILFAELQHPSKVENPQKRETKGERRWTDPRMMNCCISRHSLGMMMMSRCDPVGVLTKWGAIVAMYYVLCRLYKACKHGLNHS